MAKCKCGHDEEMHKDANGNMGACISCLFMSHMGMKCDMFYTEGVKNGE